MSRQRMIDGALAQTLFDKLGSWEKVTETISRNIGHVLQVQSIRVAASRWRRAQGLVQRRAHARRKIESGIAVMWRPEKARPLRVVPDYRTNTARPA